MVGNVWPWPRFPRCFLNSPKKGEDVKVNGGSINRHPNEVWCFRYIFGVQSYLFEEVALDV